MLIAEMLMVDSVITLLILAACLLMGLAAYLNSRPRLPRGARPEPIHRLVAGKDGPKVRVLADGDVELEMTLNEYRDFFGTWPDLNGVECEARCELPEGLRDTQPDHQRYPRLAPSTCTQACCSAEKLAARDPSQTRPGRLVGDVLFGEGIIPPQPDPSPELLEAIKPLPWHDVTARGGQKL